MKYFTIFQIDRLLELREFCENLSRVNSAFDISNEVWSKISEFYEGLKMVADKMLEFQKADLTLSDAYAQWIDLKENLKSITKETSFIVRLIAGMEEREKTLFHNSLTWASVSLDPRIQLLLSPTQKVDAALFLRILNGRIQRAYLQPSGSLTQPEPEQQPQSSSSVDSTKNKKKSNSYAGLESVLRSAEIDIENNNVMQPDHRLTIEIEMFQKSPRVSMKKSIHEFWRESRKKFPILYDLVCIIMSVPPTEVSVERNFSKLKFVLNRLRSSLSDAELENFLNLSLNSDLFELI